MVQDSVLSVPNNPGPEAIGPYSLARISSGSQILFISGHCAWDTTGSIVGIGSIGDQYRQIMKILKAIVESAGGTMDNICKLNNYMAMSFTKDSEEYLELCKARVEFFPNQLPTSTMIEVARLGDPDALVEVDAIAVLG